MSAPMRAAVIREAGGPEVLKVETLPIPQPRVDEVLLRVKLGIKAVGTVEAAPGGEFALGAVVATAMGGMRRQFDGGYAEFTLVPATQVQAIQTELPRSVLGAIPEMLQTAWGSLFKSQRLEQGDACSFERFSQIERSRRR